LFFLVITSQCDSPDVRLWEFCRIHISMWIAPKYVCENFVVFTFQCERERKHLSELEAAKERESMLLTRLRIGEENLEKCLTELAQAKVEIGDLQRQL